MKTHLFLRVNFALLVLLVFSSCSPTSFFASSQDENVIKTPNYRKINTACSNLNLPHVTLDVAEFKSLLHCLNSNGALEPIDQLVNGPGGLTEDQIQPLLDVLNEQVLGKKNRLYAIQETFRSLEKQNLNTALFLHAGKLLENTEVVTSSLKLLKKAYKSHNQEKLLEIFKILALNTNERTWKEILETGLDFTTSSAYRGLIAHLNQPTDGSRTTLQETSNGIYKYLLSSHTYLCDGTGVHLSQDFVQLIEKNLLQAAAHDFLGKSEDEIKTKTGRFAHVLQALSAPSATNTSHPIFGDLSSAMTEFNREILCLKGSTGIPNGAMHLFRELALYQKPGDPTEYFLKELPLTLVSVAPLCDYSKNIANYYPSLVHLSRTGEMEALAEIMKTAYRIESPWRGCSRSESSNENGASYHPIAQLMINFLGDREQSFQNLLPAIIGISEKKAWSNLLLTASLPNVNSEQKIYSSLKFLLEPRAELNQSSILGILSESLSLSDSPLFYHLFSGLAESLPVFEQELPLFLSGIRDAYYINSAHPFITIFQEVGRNSVNNRKFFDTLFEISERKEFNDSLRLLSTMAKDGRLNEIAHSVLALFDKFTAQTAETSPIRETQIPEFIPQRKHNLNAADLIDDSANPAIGAKISTECDKVKLDFTLTDVQDSRFQEQLQAISQCHGGNESNANFFESLQFLSNQKTPTGQSYLEHQISIIDQFINNKLEPDKAVTQSELAYLTQNWLNSLSNKNFFKLLDGAALFISGTPSAQEPLKDVLQILHRLFIPCKSALSNLETFLAQQVSSLQFPQILGDLDQIIRKLPESLSNGSSQSITQDPLDSVFTPTFKQRIRNWIDYKECSTLSSDQALRSIQVEKRSDELIQEVKNNLTNWDLIPNSNTNPNGLKPRDHWDLDGAGGLKENLGFILSKLADPAQSLSDYPLLDSFVNFLGYFSGHPHFGNAEYNAEDLLKWLRDRSTDYQLITYYYPGEEVPRVRLVNTLDRLELLLANVDFDAPPPLSKNLGLEFVAELGDAWGDYKDRKLWPKQIQEKYPDPEHPPMTLAEAVEDITNRQSETGFENIKTLIELYIGLPKLPDCHRNIPGEPEDPQAPTGGAQYYMDPKVVQDFQYRLYNITQIVSVLKDNLKGSGTGWDGGLEILRDLIFEVNYSTPQEFRTPTSGDRNNLSFVMKSVRTGMLRQVARILQKYPAGDPTLLEFVQTIVRSSQSPHLKSILATLFQKDSKQEILWQAVSHINQLANQNPTDLLALKTMTLHLPALIQRLDRSSQELVGPKQSVLDLSLWRLSEVLERHYDFIGKNEYLIPDLLNSELAAKVLLTAYRLNQPQTDSRMSQFLFEYLSDTTAGADGSTSRLSDLATLIRTFYSDGTAVQTQRTLKAKIDKILTSSEYRNLNLLEAVTPILNFLEEKSDDPNHQRTKEEIILSRKLTAFFSKILREHDLQLYLELEQHYPENFYKIFQSLGTAIGKGDQGSLKEFSQMIHRSITEPKH